MDVKTYNRRPFPIKAIRVTAENFDEVLDWCHGTKHTEPKGPYIQVPVLNPANPRQEKAFVGDWVLESRNGFKSYTNSAFHKSFDPSGTDDSQPVASPAVEARSADEIAADSKPVATSVFDQPQELFTTTEPYVDPSEQISGKR
jgi:hypothetical protein